MEPTLDEVICVLNSKSLPKSSSTHVRPGKASAPRAQVRVKSVQSSKIKKPNFRTERSVECVIPEEIDEQFLDDLNEYYREKDKEERKDTSTGGEASGAPALWLRGHTRQTKKADVPRKAVVPEQKFLIFKPFVEPMNPPPQAPPDRGYYFRLLNCDTKLIKYLLEDNGFLEVPVNNQAWTISWFGGHAKASDYQTMNRYQRVNRFPKLHEMTRKDLMYKNLAKMQALHGARNFDFAPKTFILPQEAGELEMEMGDSDEYWIVKPCASSQGKGIFLVNRFSEIPLAELRLAARPED